MSSLENLVHQWGLDRTEDISAHVGATLLVLCLVCVTWTPASAPPPPLHAPQDLNTMQHSKSELVAYGNRTFTATYHVSPGLVGGMRGRVQDKETVEEWPVAMRDMLDPAHDFSSTAHHISQWYVWKASPLTPTPHSSHLIPIPHPSPHSSHFTPTPLISHLTPHLLAPHPHPSPLSPRNQCISEYGITGFRHSVQSANEHLLNLA